MFGHDGLGSVVARVPSTGTASTTAFDAWGALKTGALPTTGNQTGYTGHTNDTEAGLIYMQARYMDPRTGTFLAGDPVMGDLMAPMGLQGFTYANSNPTRYTDPDGRLDTLPLAGIGAVLGGVGGCVLGAWSGTGCLATGTVGMAAGGLAGLTMGVSLAATGMVSIGGTALAAGGTTGSVFVAGTAAGAVGMAAGSGGSVLASGGSADDAADAALMAAPIGGVAGSMAVSIAVAAAATTTAATGSAAAGSVVGGGAGGLFGDIVAQAGMMATGLADEFNGAQAAIAGLFGALLGGVKGGQHELNKLGDVAAEGATRGFTQGVAEVTQGTPLTTPVGVTPAQFAAGATLVQSRTEVFGGELLAQGSRASGASLPTSDLDIAIRVSPEQFQSIWERSFAKVNPGSANERTALHAAETGKIQAGELKPKLSSLRGQAAETMGVPKVDISVIRAGGPFDKGPYIPFPPRAK